MKDLAKVKKKIEEKTLHSSKINVFKNLYVVKITWDNCFLRKEIVERDFDLTLQVALMYIRSKLTLVRNKGNSHIKGVNIKYDEYFDEMLYDYLESKDLTNGDYYILYNTIEYYDSEGNAEAVILPTFAEIFDTLEEGVEILTHLIKCQMS
jgi:hypothetical protein